MPARTYQVVKAGTQDAPNPTRRHKRGVVHLRAMRALIRPQSNEASWFCLRTPAEILLWVQLLVVA
jgi:hypothetical protein